jgi:hypothetical protein
VRSLSTRARISSTRFVNEYHWGDFRGDPNRLMERYYDAHLYVANWGTHRLVLRLPKDLLDLDTADEYCVGDQVSAWVSNGFILLDVTGEDHAGEFAFDDDAEALLSALVDVRAELAASDLRPLYVAWLTAYGAWERDEDTFDCAADDDLEPPVPPGLATLTAAQRALAESSASTEDLLAVAAEASRPLEETADDPRELTAWVSGLPAAEQTRLLSRVVQVDAARVRMEMLRRFHGTTAPSPEQIAAGTVALSDPWRS